MELILTGTMPAAIDLKHRERSILTLLAEGMSDREIASRLFLAPETVCWYNKQVCAKLGVTSRADAVRRARSLGLIEGHDISRRPVERTPIRYVDNEGVSIAYQVVGKGPVDPILIGGFISHIELSWDDPGVHVLTSPTAATIVGTWDVESATGAYGAGRGLLTGSADFGATPPSATLTCKGSIAR